MYTSLKNVFRYNQINKSSLAKNEFLISNQKYSAIDRSKVVLRSVKDLRNYLNA